MTVEHPVMMKASSLSEKSVSPRKCGLGERKDTLTAGFRHRNGLLAASLDKMRSLRQAASGKKGYERRKTTHMTMLTMGLALGADAGAVLLLVASIYGYRYGQPGLRTFILSGLLVLRALVGAGIATTALIVTPNASPLTLGAAAFAALWVVTRLLRPLGASLRSAPSFRSGLAWPSSAPPWQRTVVVRGEGLPGGPPSITTRDQRE